MKLTYKAVSEISNYINRQKKASLYKEALNLEL